MKPGLRNWTPADIAKHQARVGKSSVTVGGVPVAHKIEGSTLILDAPLKPSKYRNKKCEIDGLTFDSLKEGRRYVALKHMQMSGQIFALEVQYELPCMVNGLEICVYRCDFRYRTERKATSDYTYEDVKGRKQRDPVYVVKRKLVHALYGISIIET